MSPIRETAAGPSAWLDEQLSYATVNAFLDNDKAGKRALERLGKEELTVRDCSHYYPNSKDFNEYLISRYRLI